MPDHIDDIIKNNPYKSKDTPSRHDLTEQEDDLLESRPVKNITDALFVEDQDRVALVVEHEFDDLPSWVEFDIDEQAIQIMTMGGDVCEIQTKINRDQMKNLADKKNIVLVTKDGSQNIMQTLPILLRSILSLKL